MLYLRLLADCNVSLCIWFGVRVERDEYDKWTWSDKAQGASYDVD